VLTTQEFLLQMQEQLESSQLFYGHGTDNAWDEACWLFETLHRRAGILEFSAETLVDPESKVCQQVKSLLNERISSRKPMAYLLQEAWFCGLNFFVDERVLVPRSPLAELIEQEFTGIVKTSPCRILDLCTGSGCIGIACALAFPEAKVWLSDLSEEALQVAAINVERFGLEERVYLVKSDLFEQLPGNFDLIVSNPPYVGLEEFSELPDEYLAEPAMGLVTGQEGLEIPLAILRGSYAQLAEQGVLVIETGYTWKVLAEVVPQLPLNWLEFSFGGEGVCFITKDELKSATPI
jgi:ribosomal protein L3 glutamine methyltransferase